jgi:hypothetical protein
MGLTRIGLTEILKRHRLTCHCGAVELELELPDGIVDPRRCDCSFCRRRGAIAGSVAEDGFRIVKGGDVLRRYQFGTGAAEHYFCGTCGIYTHHRRRSNPKLFGYNLGGLVGVNPFDLGEVSVLDGVNHPSDRKA